MQKHSLILISILLLAVFSAAQNPNIPGMETADAKKSYLADIQDKITNSRLFKVTSFWYGQALQVVKIVNKQYDELMRFTRLIQQELAFIEYMARKIEAIAAYEFDPGQFWNSMAELEQVFNSIDEIYSTDLEYFNYLIGRTKESYINLTDFSLPSPKNAIAISRQIWGGLPDFYRTDNDLKKLPETKVINSNEFVSSQAYRLAGVAENLVSKNTRSHHKSNKELDDIGDSPTKYIQFENSFYLDLISEKIVETNMKRQAMVAQGQALLTIGSRIDQSSYPNENIINIHNTLR